MPVLGAFTPDHIPYVIDRNASAPVPTLAEMTRRALSLLKPHSFFLMIEGSRIDHAGHQNDPWTQYREVLEFDAAGTVAPCCDDSPLTD